MIILLNHKIIIIINKIIISIAIHDIKQQLDVFLVTFSNLDVIREYVDELAVTVLSSYYNKPIYSSKA
jgi:hypothetical protein